MATINPYIPIFDPNDKYPLLGLRQLIMGFFETNGRQYRVVKQEDLKGVLVEEQQKPSYSQTLLKVVALFTGVIPLLAVLWQAYHSKTCENRYKLQVNKAISGSGSTPTSAASAEQSKQPDSLDTKSAPEGAQEKQMEKTSLDLLKDFEDLFKDLKDLKAEKGQELQRKINEFENNYKDHLNDEHSKAILRFKYVKDTFEALNKLSKTLFSSHQVSNPLKDPVVEMPGDGACLFHALSIGLRFLGTVEITHEALRAQAVQWMRDHYETDSTLQAYIAEAIEAYQAATRSGCGLELQCLQAAVEMDGGNEKLVLDQIDALLKQLQAASSPLTHHDYFNLVSENSFFASIAELYAVSMLYQHQVKIVRRIGDQLFYDFDLPINPQFKARTITVRHVNGNHFDLDVPTA